MNKYFFVFFMLFSILANGQDSATIIKNLDNVRIKEQNRNNDLQNKLDIANKTILKLKGDQYPYLVEIENELSNIQRDIEQFRLKIIDYNDLEEQIKKANSEIDKLDNHANNWLDYTSALIAIAAFITGVVSISNFLNNKKAIIDATSNAVNASTAVAEAEVKKIKENDISFIKEQILFLKEEHIEVIEKHINEIDKKAMK